MKKEIQKRVGKNNGSVHIMPHAPDSKTMCFDDGGYSGRDQISKEKQKNEIGKNQRQKSDKLRGT